MTDNEHCGIRDLINRSRQNYPVYINDSEVVLYYEAAAQNVGLISDITSWCENISFARLPDEDMFYLKLKLEPDARIQYLLSVDGKEIIDPLNKYRSRHGLGTMSELAMPEYKRHPYLEGFLCGEQGAYDGLIKHLLPPGILPWEHEVYVYLPPDYNSKSEYPAVYFQDGPDYIRFGLAAHSINRLIEEKIIEPCIAVFVTPPNLHQGIKPDRSTEYGMNDDYVNFFCEELVPFIDDNYRTVESSARRLVVGDSYGGLISFYIAFSRTDVFTNAYSQSGYLSFSNYKIIDVIKNHTGNRLKLYFDIGTYEEKVGADFIPANEWDFTGANRRINDLLSSERHEFIYKEYHDGHTWGNWRRHLIDAMIYFFGTKGEGQ